MRDLSTFEFFCENKNIKKYFSLYFFYYHVDIYFPKKMKKKIKKIFIKFSSLKIHFSAKYSPYYR